MTVSNKCHHLWGRLKSAELPINAREWKIEDGSHNWISQRKELWQSYKHNVGPNLPAIEDLDFLAQLRQEVGQDLGYFSARRYALTDAGEERKPTSGVTRFSEDTSAKQIAYHGTKLHMVLNFLCEGKVRESTGLWTKSYKEGVYTMRSVNI